MMQKKKKKVREKWLLVIPRFCSAIFLLTFLLVMSCSSDKLSQRGVPHNQPHSNIVLLNKKVQGENNHDFVFV